MSVVLPDIDECMEAVQESDGTGWCLACGELGSYCEPDAEGYKCDSCGENKVMGAEQILLIHAPW